MEKETKKNVVLPGLTVCFGNQNLCVFISGSVVLEARMVIQINGKEGIPPELMQAIVKTIEGHGHEHE